MQKTTKIAAALGAVYLGWGSSYHAIRIGVEEIDPFLFCSFRFLIAGPMLFLFAVYKGQRLPGNGREWAVILGTLILMQVISSGLVAWGQQWLTSSETALIMSSAALWIAWMGSLGRRGVGVDLLNYAMIFGGVLGLYLLVSSGLSRSSAPLMGYIGVLLAAFCWSAGSVLLRQYTLHTEPLMTASLHMIIAGVILGCISWMNGASWSTQWRYSSMGALLFLVVVNSIIAYAAYYWLIYTVKPVVLGTFAYVTPAVAIAIGILLMGETLASHQAAGSIMILLSVVLSMFFSHRANR